MPPFSAGALPTGPGLGARVEGESEVRVMVHKDWLLAIREEREEAERRAVRQAERRMAACGALGAVAGVAAVAVVWGAIEAVIWVCGGR